ncbi:MAG: AraC family transcriptional regulator [Eubacterium sp.]|nr:AraC family transcriptional regulator [Eubacterium sp.]
MAMPLITILQDFLICQDPSLCLWTLSAKGAYENSNCPFSDSLDKYMDQSGIKKLMIHHAHHSNFPAIIKTSLGLTFGAAFEKNDGFLDRIYLLGPTFSGPISEAFIKQSLTKEPDLAEDKSWHKDFLDSLTSVPIVLGPIMNADLKMLHYSLTGEIISIGDIPLYASPAGDGTVSESTDGYRKAWIAEQTLLQTVRDGALDHKILLEKSSLMSNRARLRYTDEIRQMKDSTIAFTALVAHSAIAGGLSPEQGLPLGHDYISSIEQCKTKDEVMALSPAMYEDFIHRVHRSRMNPDLSPQVRKCVDYIERNLTHKIFASDLARLAGYSEYYITRKFHEEIGIGINEFIRNCKIERAKLFLQNDELTIQQISDLLGFSNRSYFSLSFKNVTGISPAEYRKKCLQDLDPITSERQDSE